MYIKRRVLLPMAYDFDVIYTLEARSNFMLDVITTRYGLSEKRVFDEIQTAIAQLRTTLDSKGVQYADLKRALVPNVDRDERAFVFDWAKFSTNWYGREVLNLMLPLLEKSSSRSVLMGDWTSKYSFNGIFCDSFGDSAAGSLFDRSRPADTLYFVYLNNLTSAAIDRLNAALSNHVAYLGSVDLTYASLMKAMLSTMLVRAFIQHRTTIIQGHEDDRPDSDDVNLVGYDFEKFGFTNRSVPGWLYGWFLSYKIERPVLPDNESDTRFSLNAMTATPYPIAQCAVELDERKLEYLRREKEGSLRIANFEALSADQIAAQIRAKLAMNYIYHLARATDADTLKFNIIIENGTVARNTCGLEYRPQEQLLKVITFF
jgi:hypothetical protein